VSKPSPSEVAAALAAWRDAAADLAFTSAFATPDGSAEYVLALARLLATHTVSPLASDEEALGRLISANAAASAALSVIEPLAGYMLSCSPGGRHMETVVLAGQAEEYHAEGSSAALALIGAMATALAGPMAGSASTGPESRTGAPLRLN
jgi:hypothetical protein